MKKRLGPMMLALAIALIFSGCKEDTEESRDTNSPIVNSSTIKSSVLDSNALILSWVAANDDVNNKSELIYRVYWSTLSNIDSLANLEQNGFLLKTVTGKTTVSIEGLPAFANNYINISVEDISGNKALYAMLLPAEVPPSSYVTPWKSSHYVTKADWVNPSSYGDSKWAFTKVNKDDRYVIAKNEVNPWSQEKYSRFDWTVDTNGDFWYCQIEYAAVDAATAEANNSADPGDLNTCGGGSWTKLVPFTDVPGTYVDSSSNVHNINSSQWSFAKSAFHVTKIDALSNYLVARNDTSNDSNPDLYSRFDWVYDGNGALFYCQIDAASVTEASADAITSADRANLGAGCGGSPWQNLSIFNEITGKYVDSSGSVDVTHDIGSIRWQMADSVFNIHRINAASDYLIAQNDPSNDWNAGLYSRMDWTRDASGDLYYCQISYDATTDANAESVTLANRASLSGGCNGWPWSKLDPFPSY